MSQSSLRKTFTVGSGFDELGGLAVMKKRMILVLLGMAVFLVVIGGVKYRQVQAAIAQHSSFRLPPEAVTTVIARRADWPASLDAIGSVVAVHGVTVSADLPGIVDRIDFDSGKAVRQGALLVALDTRQEQAQLAAAEAQQKLARLNFDRLSGLLDKGVVAQADYDRAVADLAQWGAQVREIRATIARKTIRAPFSGVLGIRQVNLGQYLAAGNPVVPLQSLDPIYVNFSVPQQEVGRLRIDADVRITADGAPGSRKVELDGKVSAIDSVADAATRNVQVQAVVSNRREILRPGMYADVQVLLGTSRSVIALPASAIDYAPYGDSVFVVAEMKNRDGMTYRGVHQAFVTLGPGRGDQIAVLSGIEAGQEVVTSGVFKLRNGGAIQVNNAVQPSDNPAPKPEDN
jgi:membrane fusion protein, multidrug efflux system